MATHYMRLFVWANPRGTDWRDTHHTTTTNDREPWRSTATITLAVHPWHGETVGVLSTWGNDGAYIERENGTRRIVPASWTSLVPRVDCRLADGRAVRLGPETALELVRWVAARMKPTEREGS